MRIADQLLLPWHPRHTISTTRAAEMLAVSRHTIVRMCEDGSLKAYRVRELSPWRIYYDSVIERIEQMNREAGVEPRFRRGGN